MFSAKPAMLFWFMSQHGGVCYLTKHRVSHKKNIPVLNCP